MAGAAAKKLTDMSLAELEDMRQGAPQNVQDEVAPYAHAAFARMVGQDSIPGAAAMALAIPAYTASKVLGLQKSRSKPSWQEMSLAYKGLWQGVRERFDAGD